MASVLYKYFPLDNEIHLERVLNCIKGYVYLSSPLNFNDPFELMVPVATPTYEKLKKFKKFSNPGTVKNFRLSSNIGTKEWLGGFGILCLTEDPMSTLMWSHYGSSHRGVCIGFKTNSEVIREAKKVSYSKERPSLPFNSHERVSDESMQSIFYNKSIDWIYEKEWRVIRRTVTPDEIEFYREVYEKDPSREDEIVNLLLHGGAGIYDIDVESIKSIFFGYNSDSKYKKIIASEAKKYGLKNSIFSLHVDNKYFSLNRVKYR